MDGLRKALLSDLGRHFKGELLADTLRCALYSTDASLFQIEPLAAACPADEDDVALLIQVANSHGIPLIARGAGTGRAGESLGSGIVVDFSRNMRQILEIGDASARVQPGVRIGELSERLRLRGRTIPGMDEAESSATLGGWASVHRSRHLSGCRLALDSADIVSTDGCGEVSPRWNEITDALGQLHSAWADVLRDHRPPHREDRCGYDIRLRSPADIDPFALLNGTEGTLGFYTELNFETVPLPADSAAILLGFDSVESACEAVPLCVGIAGPSTILDRRSLAWIRKSSAEWDLLLPADCEAALLATWHGDHPGQAGETARHCIDQVRKQKPAAGWVFPSSDPVELNRWLRLRRDWQRGFASLARGSRPLAIANDLAVDRTELPHLIREAQRVLRELDCTATLQIDGNAGHLDLRPILDFDSEADRAKLWPLADRLHALAIGLGGTICSRSGTGLARTPWVEKQTGPMYAVHQEIKRIFDPRSLFNPGKIVGLDAHRPAWPLRPIALKTVAEGKIALELAEDCNGCGDCETTSGTERTCPPFHVDRLEIGSPRGMMNSLRHLRRLPAEAKIDSGELAEIAEGCIQCQQCKTGCSAGIDIPRLMLETRIASVRENGLTWSEWFMSRSDRWLQWGSRVPALGNLLARSSLARRLLEWGTGLARDVQFPRRVFGERPFHRQPKLTAASGAGEKSVLLWAGSAANYLNPRLARATVEVLQHNGIGVEVPSRPTPSLASSLFFGDVGYAAKLLKHHIPALSAMARASGTIVCLEPSDALILRTHANLLFPEEPERMRIGAGTSELTDYLNGLHREGKLRRDFPPLEFEVNYHLPCHRKTGGASELPAWLNAIPELKLNVIDKSCSGMAGTFGLRKINRRVSLAIAEPLREALRQQPTFLSVSECAACRLQMRQLGGQPSFHPVELLHRAYFPERGLVPHG